ncbi:MAG TPA: hypothetical protein VJT15_17340 [Pyrinomonadaceae bacterium]|nr:hypothetical protein [Pyrinomonadaceae bacterium]
MRMLTKYFLWLTLLLAAAILSPGSPQTGEQSDASFIAGDWTLVTLSDQEAKRLITFDTNLAGKYYTSTNEEKGIPNATYKGDYLYFRVPELHIFFEMRKVDKRRFEGKMTRYNTNDKTTPEPVQMTKN